MFFRRGRDARRGVDILEKSALGTGSETVLFHGEDAAATDVSRDGRYIVFVTGRRGMSDIRLFDRSTKSEALWLGTPFNEGDAHFSPDGRSLVYMSNESGQPEVYVQGFPVTSGKWLVSRGGGTMPAWSADGRELFYLSADGHLMRVPVTGGASFDTGSPEALFSASVRLDTVPTRQYDVAPDGQSFLLNRMIDDVRPLNLVVNWTERVH